MFDIKFTKSAEKDLGKLPKDIQKRIIKKLKFFAAQKDPLIFAKPLVDLPPMTHRFRVGDYRIAFYTDSKRFTSTG
jgi:mRNA-degrading endonuclease RelE of RelBE toxin-antitoxin system